MPPVRDRYATRAGRPFQETWMSSFHNSEKAFEDTLADDRDLKCKGEARGNSRLAEWAAETLGLTGEAVEDYIKSVRKAVLAEKATMTSSARSGKTSTTATLL